MKHPVSVAELLELHRLGELYLKWAATPFAVSEADLQVLQEISDRYDINHSSALFSFQRQYQREMAIGIERQLDQALEVIPGLAAALATLPTTPLDAPDEHSVPEEIQLQRAERDAQLEHMREKLRKENERVTQQLAEEDPEGPHAVLCDKINPGWTDRPLLPAEANLLQQAMARVSDPEAVADRRERDEALHEQLQEDSEVDREAEAQYRADQLRDALLEEQPEIEREIEILKQISNVDELTSEESARLDELISRKVSAMNSGTHKIPVGVVQDAITTGHIEKVK